MNEDSPNSPTYFEILLYVYSDNLVKKSLNSANMTTKQINFHLD